MSTVIARKMLREIFFTRPWARALLICVSAGSAVFGILSPLLQREFIDGMIGKPSHFFAFSADHQPSPLVFLGLAFACALLSLGCFQIVSYLGALEAIFLQRRWSQQMYDRVLELRTDTLAGKPVGEIVAIYVTDLPGATILLEQSMPQVFSIVFPLLLSPFILIYVFHVSILPTMLMMGAVILMNFLLAVRQSRFFYRFKQLAADRIGLVNEWVQNIRALRVLGWVPSFEKKIIHVREVETTNRLLMLQNGQTMNAVASSITYVLNVTLISSLVFFGDQRPSPGTLMALFWVVAIFLTRSFRQMPWFFTFIFDGMSSLNRAGALFSIVNEHAISATNASQSAQDFPLATSSTALEVKNLQLKIGSKPILKSLSFSLQKGEFVAVVGAVGAGKSMLLLSLLRETGAAFENYTLGAKNAQLLTANQLRENFTYVPQEGFIMSASLRENVAFEYEIGEKFDAQILTSLQHAQFDLGQERIRDGLKTEIGERGVNLSGGQKQRVSLARVDYHQENIILLDDCLSAVDVDTEEQLLDSLIFGSWKDKTRLLVTHRLTVLPHAHRVLFMVEGELKGQGTYEQLLVSNPEFRKYTSSLVSASAQAALSIAKGTPA